MSTPAAGPARAVDAAARAKHVKHATSAAAVRRIVVVPHWRDEVGDVARTLVDCGAAGRADGVRVSTGVRAIAALAGDLHDAVLLVSDASARRLQRLVDRHADRPTFRCWWNGADEALAALADPTVTAVRRGDVHVCFFPEAARALRSAGLEVLELPYVFARPEPPAARAEVAQRRIVYTGEVDVRDDCFAVLGPVTAKTLAARTAELAVAVTEGALTAHEADRVLHDETGGAAEPYRISLWALRNRVRFRLMASVVRAFPDRVVLRGSDWQRFGFEAERTDFDRATRLAGYRSNRVALDLGSKSTHAPLYPRTAEILAIGAGLVQFDCGAPDAAGADVRAALAPRQATTAAALAARIDEVLCASNEAFVEQNLVLHAAYARRRDEIGAQFLRALLAASAG